MSDLSSVTTNYFATPKEGFTTTLASTISSGATTVPLNSITGYTNGAIATMVVEPTSSTAKQVFTGVVDTAGIQLTSVKWTEGTNQSHAAGSTVVDYVTATHMAALVKGLTTSTLDQDGTLKAGAVDNSAAIANAVVTTSKLSTELQKGWEDSYNGTTHPTPSTVTYNGNGSYDLLYAPSVAAFKSVGMRNRTTRTVTAPTQCTSLNGTTQYWSKTSPGGMTFTNNFVVSAWVKLSSYAGSQTIASRYNGTSGWSLQFATGTGQVGLAGWNGGVGNFKYLTSYQSVPLNKWVHIAAQLDMSSSTNSPTVNYVMINGVDVPASQATSGTNPTTLVQAGNLEIGSQNGGTLPLNGKIAQVAIFSAKVTQATIRGYISQGMTGSETSNISVYSFSSNANDIGASGNNLTANGSATATNADSPFGQQADGTTAGTTDYSITTKVSSDGLTETVQVPEGCAIPTSGGVSAMAYSSVKVPYGFPAQQDKWGISTLILSPIAHSGSVTNTIYNAGGINLNVPIGAWLVKGDLSYDTNPTSTTVSVYTGLSTSSSSFSDKDFTELFYQTNLAAGNLHVNTTHVSKAVSLTSATPYYALQVSTAAISGAATIRGASGTIPESSQISASFAHL